MENTVTLSWKRAEKKYIEFLKTIWISSCTEPRFYFHTCFHGKHRFTFMERAENKYIDLQRAYALVVVQSHGFTFIENTGIFFMEKDTKEVYRILEELTD